MEMYFFKLMCANRGHGTAYSILNVFIIHDWRMTFFFSPIRYEIFPQNVSKVIHNRMLYFNGLEKNPHREFTHFILRENSLFLIKSITIISKILNYYTIKDFNLFCIELGYAIKITYLQARFSVRKKKQHNIKQRLHNPRRNHHINAKILSEDFLEITILAQCN